MCECFQRSGLCTQPQHTHGMTDSTRQANPSCVWSVHCAWPASFFCPGPQHGGGGSLRNRCVEYIAVHGISCTVLVVVTCACHLCRLRQRGCGMLAAANQSTVAGRFGQILFGNPLPLGPSVIFRTNILKAHHHNHTTQSQASHSTGICATNTHKKSTSNLLVFPDRVGLVAETAC